jgi:hypothetical protein
MRDLNWHLGSSPAFPYFKNVEFRFLFGDPDTAAVYQRVETWSKIPLIVEFEDVTRALVNKQVDPILLDNHLTKMSSFDKTYHEYVKSLTALFMASQIYSTIANPIIDLTVTSSSLYNAKWIPQIRKTLTNSKRGSHLHSLLTRENSLSCIAMFETGFLNIEPSDLMNAMAISYGNSLYVSEFLFCDPFSPPLDHVIRRVIGNIGKPGLVLLLSPQAPKVGEAGLDKWPY